MTQEQKEMLLNLLDEYCRDQVNKGLCQPDCCEICPIDGARHEVSKS